MAPGRRSKCSRTPRCGPGDRLRVEALDLDRDRVRDANRVGDLELAALRQAGGDDVLGHVTDGVGGRAVDLRRVLPENAPPPWRAAPPYVSTMIFLPVRPVSPMGPPTTNLPVGLTRTKSLLEAALVVEVARKDGMEHVLDQIGLDQRLLVQPVAVLGGDEDTDDLDGPLTSVLVDLIADVTCVFPSGRR